MDCHCSSQQTFCLGEWVLVDYFKEQFHGKVVEISSDVLQIACLEKAGPYFKFPNKQDLHWYPFSDVIALLHEPELKNPRGFYSIVIKKNMK